MKLAMPVATPESHAPHWRICVPAAAALIKLVFDEPGSEPAAELWDRAESVVSSQLIYPEARAAAAAAHRGDRITSPTLRRAVERIEGLCAELEIIGLDPDRGSVSETLGRWRTS